MKEKSPTDLTDLHRFSSLHATVLTMIHKQRLREESKICENLWDLWENKKLREESKICENLWDLWENEKLREESKIRSIRSIRVQESGTAQRPLNIQH